MDVLLRGGPRHGEEWSFPHGDEVAVYAPRAPGSIITAPVTPDILGPHDLPIRYRATGRYDAATGRRIFEYVEPGRFG